jgi:hypothetical protein
VIQSAETSLCRNGATASVCCVWILRASAVAPVSRDIKRGTAEDFAVQMLIVELTLCLIIRSKHTQMESFCQSVLKGKDYRLIFCSAAIGAYCVRCRLVPNVLCTSYHKP